MITQLLDRLEKGIKQYREAKTYLTALLKGTSPKRDEELTKRFVQENKETQPTPDLINSKINSMKKSQGVSGFSGSAYKGPGNVNHDKVISNRARKA